MKDSLLANIYGLCTYNGLNLYLIHITLNFFLLRVRSDLVLRLIVYYCHLSMLRRYTRDRYEDSREIKRMTTKILYLPNEFTGATR